MLCFVMFLTDLPLLMEHIKKLYVSHSMKEMKDYVSDVSGIISYLHFSKNTHSEKVYYSSTTKSLLDVGQPASYLQN